MSHPLFSPEESARQARKLSDALNECIREAFRPIGRDRLIYETARARPTDELDEAAADPIHDHRPQSRPKHKVRGVLAILDQLDKESSNRRCERP